MLVVEDDAKIADLLKRGLSEEGIRTDIARDGEEGILFAADREYDCIILDRRLPRIDGDSLLRRWREEKVQTPILMLTALDQVEDRVNGLEIGADDYLVKPFAFDELLARVYALFRRSHMPLRTGEPAIGGLEIDLRNRVVWFRGAELPLTDSEFRIAALLARNAGRTVTRTRLMEAVWDEPWEGSDNALEAHVKNVRKKLASAAVPVAITAVRGIGYRMVKSS